MKLIKILATTVVAVLAVGGLITLGLLEAYRAFDDDPVFFHE